MKACDGQPRGRCIVGPVDMAGERYGGDVDVGTRWSAAKGFVNDRVRQFQVGVQCDDGMYILNGYLRLFGLD